MPSDTQRPPDRRLIVGITGRIGAGKTSAAQFLSSKYGFQYLRYSLVLSEWLADGPEDKARLQQIGWEVMASGRQAELNRLLIAQIRPDADAVVDGLRHPLDDRSLRDHYAASFHLLYIDSSQKDRWARLNGRGRYTTLESFEAADSQPVEQRIESLRVSADLVLHNEGSLEDLYSALDNVVLAFRKEGHV